MKRIVFTIFYIKKDQEEKILLKHTGGTEMKNKEELKEKAHSYTI